MSARPIFPVIGAMLALAGANAQDAPKPATPAEVKPAEVKPAAPAPAEVKPGEDAAKPAKPKGDLITVTSEGGAEIDQKKNVMIYLQKVRFDHPTQNLVLTSDRLEVYREPPPPPKPKPALEAEAAGAAATPEEEKQPDIKEAIATGNVVITKKTAEGKTSIGRGQRAHFDAKSQVIVLSGSPQPSLDIGQDYLFYADTITLQENGQHKLGKNARTVFKKQKQAEGGKAGDAKP